MSASQSSPTIIILLISFLIVPGGGCVCPSNPALADQFLESVRADQVTWKKITLESKIPWFKIYAVKRRSFIAFVIEAKPQSTNFEISPTPTWDARLRPLGPDSFYVRLKGKRFLAVPSRVEFLEPRTYVLLFFDLRPDEYVVEKFLHLYSGYHDVAEHDEWPNLMLKAVLAKKTHVYHVTCDAEAAAAQVQRPCDAERPIWGQFTADFKWRPSCELCKPDPSSWPGRFGRRLRFAVIGDSHARHIYEGLVEAIVNKGFTVNKDYGKFARITEELPEASVEYVWDPLFEDFHKHQLEKYDVVWFETGSHMACHRKSYEYFERKVLLSAKAVTKARDRRAANGKEPTRYVWLGLKNFPFHTNSYAVQTKDGRTTRRLEMMDRVAREVMREIGVPAASSYDITYPAMEIAYDAVHYRGPVKKFLAREALFKSGLC